MPPFAAVGVLPAVPNIPPPGPVASIGAPNTLIGFCEPELLGPGEADPNALKSPKGFRGGEDADAAADPKRGGEDGISGDEGVGGAPGTGRRGGSLPPGVYTYPEA